MVEPPGRIYKTYVEESEDDYLCLSPTKIIGDNLGKIAFNFTGNDEAYCGFVIGTCVFYGNNKHSYKWEDCEFEDRCFVSEGAPNWSSNFIETVSILEWQNIDDVYFISTGDEDHSQNFVTKDPISFLKGFYLAKTEIDDISILDVENLKILVMKDDALVVSDITYSEEVNPDTHIEIYDLR